MERFWVRESEDGREWVVVDRQSGLVECYFRNYIDAAKRAAALNQDENAPL